MMTNQVGFWQQRWVNNQTGFHEAQVNEYLEKHQALLTLPDGGSVFLPLCGKSQDIIWLSELGFKVIGVECSELAVTAFFTENNLEPVVTEQGDFKVWKTTNITIYCGDFYQLQASWFDTVTAIFDRAALVALPQEQRTIYVEQLQKLCPRATILFVSLEYPQAEMSGPPFAVVEDEVRELFHTSYNINLIESNDILAENDKFKERGLSALIEKVFLISPN